MKGRASLWLGRCGWGFNTVAIDPTPREASRSFPESRLWVDSSSSTSSSSGRVSRLYFPVRGAPSSLLALSVSVSAQAHLGYLSLLSLGLSCSGFSNYCCNRSLWINHCLIDSFFRISLVSWPLAFIVGTHGHAELVKSGTVQ